MSEFENTLEYIRAFPITTKAHIQQLQSQLEACHKQRDGLANFNPDWDMLEATQDSLREYMALLKDCQEKLEASEKLLAKVYTIAQAIPAQASMRNMLKGVEKIKDLSHNQHKEVEK